MNAVHIDPGLVIAPFQIISKFFRRNFILFVYSKSSLDNDFKADLISSITVFNKEGLKEYLSPRTLNNITNTRNKYQEHIRTKVNDNVSKQIRYVF